MDEYLEYLVNKTDKFGTCRSWYSNRLICRLLNDDEKNELEILLGGHWKVSDETLGVRTISFYIYNEYLEEDMRKHYLELLL